MKEIKPLVKSFVSPANLIKSQPKKPTFGMTGLNVHRAHSPQLTSATVLNGRSGRHVVDVSTRCCAGGNAIVPFLGVMMPEEKVEAHKMEDSRAVEMQFSSHTVL